MPLYQFCGNKVIQHPFNSGIGNTQFLRYSGGFDAGVAFDVNGREIVINKTAGRSGFVIPYSVLII
jgi:hypothetical protein